MTRRAAGEGSVFRTPNRSTWTAKIKIAGVEVRRAAATQRDAVRLLAQLRRERDAPVPAVTVGEYLATWIAGKRDAGGRVHTLRGYAMIVDQYVVPEVGAVRLATLGVAEVEGMCAAMVARGLSGRTAGAARSVLANALHDAERAGLVARNVASLAHPPRVEHRERVALSGAEVSRLLAALEGDPWRAAYVLAAVLGMRQGEVLGLRWADVAGDVLHVRQTVRRAPGAGGAPVYEPPKSPRSRRALPLPPLVLAALADRAAWQAREQAEAGDLWQDAGLVLTGPRGEPLHPGAVIRRLYRAIKVSKVPAVTFHDLRHSAASMMANAGVPPRVVADVLGHSRITTTLDLYTHTPAGAMRDALAGVGSNVGNREGNQAPDPA